MKREILFRGKRTDGKGFVEGDLMQKYIHHEGLTIVQGGCVYCEVIPGTIGQFTGLTDKNGVKIFEGDIVLAMCSPCMVNKQKIHKCEIHYSELHHGWDVSILDYKNGEKWATKYMNWGFRGDKLEVIGNIHDNKELLNHERVH